MKFRNTLILFGIVIVLFILIYVFEIRKPEESNGKSRNLGKMLLVEQGNVNKVELIYTNVNYERILCSRDDSDQWRIEQPLKAKADQKAVDRLISRTTSKNVQSTLKEPGSLTEYGLDKPRVTATFYLRDGTSRTLMLGDTVPTGNYVYTKQKSSPDIFTVPASIVDDLAVFVSDLRDQTVMDFKSADVQKIQLRYAHRDRIVCERSGFEWRMTEPISAKADAAEVEKIISNLRNLRLDVFVGGSSIEKQVVGLSQPQIEVIVSLGDETSRSLLVGNEKNGSVYVKTASDKAVFLVNGEIVGKLEKKPVDLRDKAVMAFRAENVEKLELRYPEQSLVCERKSDADGDTWEILAPTRAKADKSQIDEILRKLQELKADEFVSDEAGDLAMYGLAQPVISATIFPEGSESETLLVGKRVRESVYVKRKLAGSVYLVDAGIVRDLSKKPLDLYHRQVMKFAKDDATRIELRNDNKAVVCIKQERDWRLVEPIRNKAKNYVINEILQQLGDLKAERFIAERAMRLSAYGLDRPDVEVITTLADSSKKSLQVGKKLPDGGSAYAKIADRDFIFVIGKDVVDKLKKDVNDIKE